jgi:hypothetical protein
MFNHHINLVERLQKIEDAKRMKKLIKAKEKAAEKSSKESAAAATLLVKMGKTKGLTSRAQSSKKKDKLKKQKTPLEETASSKYLLLF